MNRLNDLTQAVCAGALLGYGEALELWHAQPLEELCRCADRIRRARCGSNAELCTIINAKNGGCTEDCAYCAQASRHFTHVLPYPLLGQDAVLAQAKSYSAQGARRFAMVTSGRRLSGRELKPICSINKALREECPSLRLCASHGLLAREQLQALKSAGVTRYHNNLETSRRFFPRICTTHTYEDKIRTIRAAQSVGLEVCSGGIFGLGETVEDRIDLALELRGLGIRSVPLNVLSPIPGTPLEHRPPLSEEELLRTAAVFRFLLPDSQLRLAGGRGSLPDHGASLFQCGVNAAISGDMLTTAGYTLPTDRHMLQILGFEVLPK